MNLIDQVKNFFTALIEQENGNLNRIAKQSGVAYPIIHRLKNGKTDFVNMSIGTFAKLFPHLKITNVPNTHSNFTQGQQENYIDQQELENQILHDDYFTAEERVKFLLWLKDKSIKPKKNQEAKKMTEL